MKTIYLLFACISSCFVYAQNTIRVYYQTVSKTNPNEIYTEEDIYLLEIDTQKQTSKFYNETYRALDSTYAKLREMYNISGTVSYDTRTMKFPKFNIGVVDNGKEYQVFRVFDGEIYQYSESKHQKWTIEHDIQTLEGYNVQKATAHVNGRDWEVYFATELPLPFGPYVLGQLPGLVVSAKDSTGSYAFKIIGIQKNIQDDDFLPSQFKTPIRTTKSKYKKAFESFKKDPARKLRQNIVTQPDGNYMTLAQPLPVDYVKRKEKELIKYYKEHDNDIDQDK